MSGLISLVPRMDSLKQLSWRVVKEVVKEKKKRTMKDVRKEMAEGTGKRRDESQIKKVEDVAKEVGWLDVVNTQWKIQNKKVEWEDVHRDIVST